MSLTLISHQICPTYLSNYPKAEDACNKDTIKEKLVSFTVAKRLRGAKCGNGDEENTCQDLNKILKNRKMYIHT